MSSVITAKKSLPVATKSKWTANPLKAKKEAIFEPRGPADGEPGRREVERRESTRFQTATKFLKSLRPGHHEKEPEEGRLDRNSTHYQSEGKGMRAKRKNPGHKVGPVKETERSQSFHEKRRFSFNANADGVSYDPKVAKIDDRMKNKDAKWLSSVDGVPGDDPSGKENIPLQQLSPLTPQAEENIYENIASLANNGQKVVCMDSSTRGEPVGAETEVLNTLNLGRLEKGRRSFRKLTKDSGYETNYAESDYANLDVISHTLDAARTKSEIDSSTSLEDLSSSEIYSVPSVEKSNDPWANLSSARSHRKYGSSLNSQRKNAKLLTMTKSPDRVSVNSVSNTSLQTMTSSLPSIPACHEITEKAPPTDRSEIGSREVNRKESLRCFKSNDETRLNDKGGKLTRKHHYVHKNGFKPEALPKTGKFTSTKFPDPDSSCNSSSYSCSSPIGETKSQVVKMNMYNMEGWEEGGQLTDDEYVSHLRSSSYQLLQGRHHGNSVFQSHPYIAHVRQSSNQSNGSDEGGFLCYPECFPEPTKPNQASSVSPTNSTTHWSSIDSERSSRTSSPPLPPVRDASSLKYIKYGPGHEKYPSWPVAPDGGSSMGEGVDQTLLQPGGSHRSKSWTEETDYPKEKQPSYARPVPKKNPSFSQQLKTVTETSERTLPDPDPASFSTSLDAMYKPSHTYYPPYDKDGREFGDKDYQTPSPPERDCPAAFSLNFNDYVKKYGESLDNYAYYDIPPPEKWTKDNFPNTPFMDKLRRESCDPSNFWTSGESDKASHKDSGRESVTTVVTNSSSNSSNETLKWHGSSSDLSVFSNHSRLDPEIKQSVAFSSKVKSPQKYHPESVTFHKLEKQLKLTSLALANHPNNDIKIESGESPSVDSSKQPSVQQRILELERLERQSKSVPNLCAVRDLQVKKMTDSQLSIESRLEEQSVSLVNGEVTKYGLPSDSQFIKGEKSFTYYDPTKRHKVSDPTLKAIQKQALLSYYERQTGRSKGGHIPRENRLDSSRIKKRSSSLSRDSSMERDSSFFPEIAPKAGRALARLDKVLDVPRGNNSQLKRKNPSMTKSYSESEFSLDKFLRDNWQEEAKENLPRISSTGNTRRELPISISSSHLAENSSSNKNSIFLTSAIKTDPEGPYLSDHKKDIQGSLSAIPPERPPKKPHLRAISQNFKEQPNNGPVGGKSALRKPRAPDPPASPILSHPPEGQRIPSPSLSSRSESPDFPPPPPMSELEIMSMDEAPALPPTLNDGRSIPDNEATTTNNVSYHKDSYTVHRKEKKFSLCREEKYRSTVNNATSLLEGKLQERPVADSKVGKISGRSLSTSTLTPNSWEKFHNIRQQNITTVFNSTDPSSKSASLPRTDVIQRDIPDPVEDVPCEWVVTRDTPCSPSSRSHTSSSFLSSLSSGSVSPSSPSHHEEPPAPSWRASLDSLIVPSVASSSSSASSSLSDKYRRAESQTSLSDPSEIKGALQTLRSAYISRGLNLDLSIMTERSTAISPPPVPLVVPPSYSICSAKETTPRSSPVKPEPLKLVTEVMTQTTPSVVKIGRQKCKEEIECEELGNDLARQLPQGHRLHTLFVCDPSHKTSADYMEGIFAVDKKQTLNKKVDQVVSRNNINTNGSFHDCQPVCLKLQDNTSSLPADSAYFTTSESKAKFLNRYINDISRDDLKEMGDGQQLTKKKEELVQRISKKLEILREEYLSIKEEMELNEKLGADVTCRVEKLALPNEFEKFKLHVEEADKITSLLLALSGRLARAENALMNLPQESDEEKKSLESKRDKLKDQLEEAKKLKESLDRRSNLVSNFLHKYLSTEEYADYDHFIKMKSKLIIDSREVDEKIKLGEEQMEALKETLSSPRTS